MEGAVSGTVWLHAAQEFPRTSKFRGGFVVAVGEYAEGTVVEVRRGLSRVRMVRMRRVSTVAPPLVQVGKVVEQLVIDLIRHLQLFLQGYNLVYQDLVALREAEVVLLELLNLVLSRIQRLAQERNLLVG